MKYEIHITFSLSTRGRRYFGLILLKIILEVLISYTAAFKLNYTMTSTFVVVVVVVQLSNGTCGGKSCYNYELIDEKIK